MIEVLIRMEAGRALDEERRVGPLLAALCRAPGLEPVRYDLNGMGNWRSVAVEDEAQQRKLVVDAMTQRTQLVRIEGEGEALAMVALGKHGEPPTAVLRLPWPPGSLQDLVGLWRGLDAEVGTRRVTVTAPEWREALGGAGAAEASEVPGMVEGWCGAEGRAMVEGSALDGARLVRDRATGWWELWWADGREEARALMSRGEEAARVVSQWRKFMGGS